MPYLGDVFVSDELYQQASAVKSSGGKVFLVLPEIIGDEGAKLCSNCKGPGGIGLQIFVGGPYDFIPTIKNGGKFRSDGMEETHPRATFYEEKWYKQKTRTYKCPVCEGTGAFVNRPGRSRELAF